MNWYLAGRVASMALAACAFGLVFAIVFLADLVFRSYKQLRVAGNLVMLSLTLAVLIGAVTELADKFLK